MANQPPPNKPSENITPQNLETNTPPEPKKETSGHPPREICSDYEMKLFVREMTIMRALYPDWKISIYTDLKEKEGDEPP
jgi:hypothetical protein